MEAQTYKLVYEGDGFLVVAKQAGYATVPLKEGKGEPSMLEELGVQYPKALEPMGPLAREGGVLHRLDSLTSGLVLVATDRNVYERLWESQQKGEFWKTYLAASFPSSVYEGFPRCPYHSSAQSTILIESMFRPYGRGRKAVRPFQQGKGRVYVTQVTNKGMLPDGETLFSCCLEKGFRHQVRCHLAWIGYPITGDALYGGREAPLLHLCAVALRFPDPLTKKSIEIVLHDPPAWLHK